MRWIRLLRLTAVCVGALMLGSLWLFASSGVRYVEQPRVAVQSCPPTNPNPPPCTCPSTVVDSRLIVPEKSSSQGETERPSALQATTMSPAPPGTEVPATPSPSSTAPSPFWLAKAGDGAFEAESFEPFEPASNDATEPPTTSAVLMPVMDSVGRPNWINLTELTVTDHKAKWTEPLNGRLYCEFSLLHSELCGDDESAKDCVERLGKQRVAQTIPIRCSQSKWFRQLKVRRRKVPVSADPIDAGLLPRSMVLSKPASYVLPADRILMPMPPGRMWASINRTVHRIPMAIPEEAIARRVKRNKLFDWNPQLPTPFPLSATSTYSLGRQDEVLVRELNSLSYFAWTHRRGCWTAQRHLDILAAGGVPFFLDLDLCEDYHDCLPGYPVKLVLSARQLPGLEHILGPQRSKYIDQPKRYYYHNVHNPLIPGDINWTTFNKTQYFQLADELLAYTQRYLTTKALASYFLEVMGRPNARVVFVTSYWWLPHTVSLVHGLAALGLTVYTNVGRELRKLPNGTLEEQAASMRAELFFAGYRGAGHLFGLRGDSTHLRTCGHDGVDCLEKLKSGEIELVAYCISNDGNKADYYDEYVRDNFDERRVAFIDGVDQANSFNQHFAKILNKSHVLFSRETHHTHLRQ